MVDGHELSHRSVPRKLSPGEDEGNELPGRWVNSHELQAGDTITTKSGERYRVTAISQRFAIDHPVSNLSVQQHRNYTVGRHSVLVHNESICEVGEEILAGLLKDPDFDMDDLYLITREFTNGDDVYKRLSQTRPATVGNAVSTGYRRTFFDEHPELEGRVVVHHAVEQQILRLYPGLFKEAEIHPLEHLRGIPIELNSVLHLSQIRKEWNAFYKAHPTATRQQMCDEATRIDSLFGGQFNPRI